MGDDTIVALSSGANRAAIAVLRVSGNRARFVADTILEKPLVHRRAQRSVLRDPVTGARIDECVAVLFAGPHSATGEDVLELHVHGSPAVITAVLALLPTLANGIRLAEPGEFTRRSLFNGKLDLLQVEALGELLAAETDAQLHQAQRQLSGELGRIARRWADQLVLARSWLEAELDFSDEGDVDTGAAGRARQGILVLREEVGAILAGEGHGRRIREGFSVVIAGRPNAGKSSLLNALVKRDVAIVSDQPGTTRDIIETPVSLGGWPVVYVDSAGIQETSDLIEREGVRRALARVQDADLVISVFSHDIPELAVLTEGQFGMVRVYSKADLGGSGQPGVVQVSSLTGEGLDLLKREIIQRLGASGPAEASLVSRERQRRCLGEMLDSLDRALLAALPELAAEDLRGASAALSRLVGQTDLDTVLDRLFEGFCIGK
ncbi:MAG: tRNA uridine-5-carboxymethylaminomethyl(34) synthesis GTPase MnmE [Hyphomicrobiales bacterium]|nr:tRNA uridine-5-carboxymethylaminomethyl(34) synthesis GTPase MnmE [Hyphomicrobiales bacterium]